jgi:CheY-like chemotaxis protein
MKKVLILLNDSDPLMARVCKNKFQKEGGWDTTITSKCEEALDVVKKEHPDLVITEIIMSDTKGRTGFDLIAEVRGSNKDVCIIAFSELGNQEDKEKAFAAGADRYYAKSEVSVADVIEEIKTLV